jgi:hypothetical protein
VEDGSASAQQQGQDGEGGLLDRHSGDVGEHGANLSHRYPEINRY